MPNTWENVEKCDATHAENKEDSTKVFNLIMD